jgi:hypothetical protein
MRYINKYQEINKYKKSLFVLEMESVFYASIYIDLRLKNHDLFGPEPFLW